MVQPAKFRSIEFEWDEHNLSEITGHGVSADETEQCFYNRHKVYRNKRKGRPYLTYKLEGVTDRGRALVVIFFVKQKTTVRSPAGACALIRVITAWEK